MDTHDLDRRLDDASYQYAHHISTKLLSLRGDLREWFAHYDEGLSSQTTNQLAVLLTQLDLTLLALHEDQGQILTDAGHQVINEIRDELRETRKDDD